MLLFRRARQRHIDKLLERIDNKDLVKRYFFLLLGCFIVAFAFNVFFKHAKNFKLLYVNRYKV